MNYSEKKELQVCFSIEKSYAQHVCVTISSLLKNNPDVFFSVHIFSFGLSKSLKTSIQSVLSDYTNYSLAFVDADIKLVTDFKVTGHASPVNYLRLFIANLLPQLDKILYLDCDIIVRSSVIELYEMDINNFLFAAVPQQELERSAVLGIGENDYFNSGVLLMNLAKWRSMDATNKLTDFILNNPSKIHYWDQDALSAIYHSEYLKLDEKWNFMNIDVDSSALDAMDVRIIHFAGKHKPWSPHSIHPLKNEYYKYLKDVEFKRSVWGKVKLLKLTRTILSRIRKKVLP